MIKKIKTQEGNSFVEANRIVGCNVVNNLKKKGDAEPTKYWISVTYEGSNTNLLVGSFATETDAENVIINDLSTK